MNEETQRFVNEHLGDDVRALALKKFPADVDKLIALTQIEARRIFIKKVPSWAENQYLEFPAHLSVEQCSSELTALYKSSLVQGKNFADLTGGMGIDTYFMSKSFETTHYIECQEVLCNLARHNFKVLNAGIEVFNLDSKEYLSKAEHIDYLYLDPARRDKHGHKMVSLHDCTPDVLEILDLLFEKSDNIMLKLSPMIDIDFILNELPCVKDIHVVALKNECKEVLILMHKGFEGVPEYHCVDLEGKKFSFTFFKEEERDCPLITAENIGKYLYEPDVSLLKAGAFKLLARRYNISKLHKDSHLYTSKELVKDFSGRIFEIVDNVSFNKKGIQELLKDIKKANIAVRNFPLSVDEIRKRYHILEGGDDYLFGTTLRGERLVIIRCKKLIIK